MSPTPDHCIHLTVDMIREIHDEAITNFGGSHGVADENLLSSACAAPQATYGGQSPFNDLVEIAAAYLFYLCRNHAFVDGNKRTAMMATIVFLRLNEIDPPPDSDDWETLVLDVASSKLNRDETTARLKRLLKKRR